MLWALCCESGTAPLVKFTRAQAIGLRIAACRCWPRGSQTRKYRYAGLGARAHERRFRPERGMLALIREGKSRCCVDQEQEEQAEAWTPNARGKVGILNGLG